MLKIVIGMLFASALLAVAGCGGKSEAEKEREAAAAASGSGRGTITCEGSATSEPTGLPAGFPQPDAVTYVNATKSGPTVVVDGYSTESLEGMYVEYKDRINEAGYKVEFSELEKDRGDSEVAYKTSGAGSTEGIVALRGGESCANGNVSVHITNRPSG
jgi:ABC-type phosphate transport system substrate-binding protein